MLQFEPAMCGNPRFAVPMLAALMAPLLAAGCGRVLAISPGAPAYDLPPDARARALPVRFRTWPEHAEVRARAGEPYILELGGSGGALVYYGARHAGDAVQNADIAARWAKFRPTVALCEGRARRVLVGSLARLFAQPNESDLVHHLARRDGVALYSLEPRYEDEVARLLERWAPERVALLYTMSVYWSEARGKADDGLAADLLRKRTDVAGLRGTLATVADIDALWRRDFPGAGDWRTLRGSPPGSYLRQMSEQDRADVRDQHMARLLIHLVRRGERVFAVVGSGHVIRKEWTLRAALSPYESAGAGR